MSGEHALHFLKVYSMYMGISTFLFLMSNSVVENITIRVHHHSSLDPCISHSEILPLLLIDCTGIDSIA